jgi:hypothetical protein
MPRIVPPLTVILAKAGIHSSESGMTAQWIPAFARMTM